MPPKVTREPSLPEQRRLQRMKDDEQMLKEQQKVHDRSAVAKADLAMLRWAHVIED